MNFSPLCGFLPIPDTIVPVLFCLLVEKGLAQEMIIESAGMIAHVVNIIVLVLIPMVLIHYKGHQFSLCKYNFVINSIDYWE